MVPFQLDIPPIAGPVIPQANLGAVGRCSESVEHSKDYTAHVISVPRQRPKFRWFDPLHVVNEEHTRICQTPETGHEQSREADGFDFMHGVGKSYEVEERA